MESGNGSWLGQNETRHLLRTFVIKTVSVVAKIAHCDFICFLVKFRLDYVSRDERNGNYREKSVSAYLAIEIARLSCIQYPHAFTRTIIFHQDICLLLMHLLCKNVRVIARFILDNDRVPRNLFLSDESTRKSAGGVSTIGSRNNSNRAVIRARVPRNAILITSVCRYFTIRSVVKTTVSTGETNFKPERELEQFCSRTFSFLFTLYCRIPCNINVKREHTCTAAILR